MTQEIRKYIAENISELAKEILDWKKEGFLEEGCKMRKLQKMVYDSIGIIDEDTCLVVAQNEVVTVCLEYIVVYGG